MREQKFEDYFGRKIAIDASMHIYQFLVRYVLYSLQYTALIHLSIEYSQQVCC